MESPDAVFEALRENSDRPYGRQRTVRAEELVEAAEQFEEKGALVTALFELMSAYTYSGEDRKSPVVFARIAQLWDSHPKEFSEWEAHQFYWRFKWVATALLQVPDVPLTAIERWLGEMRERYQKAGHDLQPVYAMRHHIATHTGVGRAAAYDLWATRGRTELSDCEACETRHRALFHVAEGDDARALREWQPVLEGGQTCLEEPYVSKAYALLPLVRSGRLDEARSHHLTGYRFARGKPDLPHVLGLHAEFCALTRNEARGLEILAENRAMFDVVGAPLDRLEWMTGVQVLLGRLAAQGHGDLAVAGPPGRNWTVQALLAFVAGEGDRLAAAFDARNGTSAVSAGRRERLARQPLLDEPLVLGIRAVLPSAEGAAGGAVPAAATGAGAEPVPQELGDLVARARELTRIGRPDADPLWDLVRARTQADGYTHDEDALGPLAVLRAELAERAAFEGFEREEWPQARAAMLTAAGLYDEAGLAGRAAAARARAATAVVASAEDDPTADLTEPLAELAAQLAAAEELLAEERIEPDRYLAVLQCDAMVARHRLIAELPDAGEEVRTAFEAAADRLLTEAGRLGSPQRASAARQYAGDVAARSGDFTRATAELGAALELVEEADQPWRAPRPLALLAQIELFRGRPEEAVALCHRALAAAARWPDRSLALAPFHALLGHASAAAGDTAAAVRHLSEAADRFDRSPARDSAGQAAQVRLELADMLGAQDRTADAVAVLESVVLGDTSGLDPRLVAQIRLNLGRGLAALGEHRAAAEEFIGLADTVAAWTDEQVTHTLVASEAAVALAEAGQWEAAAAAYARAVASHRRAPRPGAVLQMMRTFARLTMAAREAEGLDAALGHLAEADALLAEVPADSPDIARWYQVGATHYQRSRAYADAASYPEALAEIERAVAAYESGGTPGEEPRAEAVRIAALIEANGLHDPAAATARLTETIARCEAAQLPAAAQTLTALRARLQANAKKSAQGG